jgi:hypothetical protein
MKQMLRLLAITGLAVLASSCAKTHARTIPERPPLEVPPAPARVIEPILEATELPGDLAGAEPALTPQAPSRPAPRPAARPGAARPDASPGSEAAVPAEAGADAQPSSGEPQLRTPQAADDGEVARKIRDTLARASRNLSSVQYTGLRPDARLQYDTARNFLTQAEEAVRIRNYTYAVFLADKADTIARQLLGR